MDKIPMTRRGFTALENELRTLKGVERPAVIEAIAVAREHGDLKENAEYHAAKEKQSFIEGRIMELQAKLGQAEVIDLAQVAGSTIKFGASVTVLDDDTEVETTYQLVGEDEADINKKLLSITSPLGRKLIGKKVGDYIELQTPKGEKGYEVMTLAYEE